jgi:FAD/FMN-containing dehydrogenase
MAELTRRQAILLAGATLMLSGCTSPATPTASPTAAGTPTAVKTATAADWQAFAAQLKGALVLPADADYAQLKLVENPRFDDAQPLAILEASSADDVAAAITFATAHAVPLAIRSGGHSYPGYSAGGASGTDVPPSLVVDVRPLNQVTMAGDGTATIGAGAALASVYAALAAEGRAIGAGSCATVGVAGLTLGGGVGVLTRTFGLTCDQVTAIEIVTADGKVVTASATNEPELFWALRGGGGGHLGVVTSFTFQTQAAPTVTMFFLSWPFAQAAAVVEAWQSWMPQTDPGLWSTLKLLGGPVKHPTGPAITMSGTWLGAPAQLAAQLAGLTNAVKPSTNTSSTHDYGQAMAIYAGCSNIAVAQCNTGPGGSLKRESFGATSHIAQAPLDAAGIQALIGQATAAGQVGGMIEGGVSIDALGGQVAKVGAGDTAFPWRDALATVQYTATFENGADPAPFDAYARGFRQAMQPHWGDGAYVNYSDASITDPDTAYFGANKARLQAARKKYDPSGLFTQPQ